MAPEARSRTMVALTPGFLERRPKVSSRASGPAPLCRRDSQTKANKSEYVCGRSNVPKLCLT
jgi:hypothetical protein